MAAGYLASTMDVNPVGWGIGAVIPNIFGFVVLLILNGRATKALESKGWKVGLAGARPPESPTPESDG